jgi:hypothetical protein
VLETRFLGYLKLKDSPNPILRQKGGILRETNCVRAPGLSRGPIARSQRHRAEMDRRSGAAHPRRTRPPTLAQNSSPSGRGRGAVDGVTLKFDLFQHPKLQRTTYRLPEKRWSEFRLWEEFQERSRSRTCRSRSNCNTPRNRSGCGWKARFVPRMRKIGPTHPRFTGAEQEPAGAGPEQAPLGQGGQPEAAGGETGAYRSQIRLVLPKLQAAHPELILLASAFQHYKG